jgi:hypothetical protein
MIWKKIVAIPADEPKLKDIKSMGILSGLLFMAMIVFQIITVTGVLSSIVALFSYDTVMAGVVFSPILIGILIFIEVFSIPFLTGMRASVLMRLVSMVFGWIAAFVLIASSVLLNVSDSHASLVILDNLMVPLDWLFTALALGLGATVAWTTWGRWPARELAMMNEYRKLSPTERDAYSDKVMGEIETKAVLGTKPRKSNTKSTKKSSTKK